MSLQNKKQLFLISGESATGKSASLMNIKNQEKWLYLNTESGKALPFKNNFYLKNVTDPYQLKEAFEYITNNDDFDGIIIDSLTFLMDMYETLNIITAKDSRAAWSNYGQYFKVLMQIWVPSTDKHVIVIAHTRSDQDSQLIERVSVPIKGALKNTGIESYFSTVVSTKRVSLTQLKNYESNLLNITDEDVSLGFKYVFQTRLTKETIGERIRGPMGLFSEQETFIDNDADKLLSHMIEYYK